MTSHQVYLQVRIVHNIIGKNQKRRVKERVTKRSTASSQFVVICVAILLCDAAKSDLNQATYQSYLTGGRYEI